MQVDSQDYLRLVQKSGSLVFLDIEATGLRGDYNSVLCVSLKPYGKRATTFECDGAGDDKTLCLAVSDYLKHVDCIVTYYGKGFDIPMLNTRLLNHKQFPLNPLYHIDLYFTLKSKLLTARRSQGHLLSWLQAPQQKMGVSAEMWNRVLNPKTHDAALDVMRKRCESDVAGLEGLYRRTAHLIKDIKKG